MRRKPQRFQSEQVATEQNIERSDETDGSIDDAPDVAEPKTPAFGATANRLPKKGNGAASFSLTRKQDPDQERVNGARFAASPAKAKTEKDTAAPLDFSKGQDKNGVDDETTDVLKRTKLGGKSAYTTDIGPEPKGKAADSAVYRAAAIGAAWNRSEAEAKAMIEMRFRMAAAPAYSANPNEAVGGPHYIAPVAAFVNTKNLGDLDLGPAEMKEMVGLQSRVAKVLLGEGVSKTERVKLARLMSIDPTKVTAMNVDAMLTKLAARGEPAAKETPKTNALGDAIAKRRDYIDNPPADYNIEKVKGIIDWATTQKERADAEVAKMEKLMDTPSFDHDRYDYLSDTQTDLRLLVKQTKEHLQAEKDMAEADKKNGTNLFGGNAAAPLGKPSGRAINDWRDPRKLNAQTPYSGKLADKPIFSDLAAGSAEGQALVGRLDARLGRSAEGRRAAVLPESQNADTARAERVAGAMGKRVVWVRNLGADGVSDPVIPGVIFLDPASRRSVQVLAAHELTHSLERDNPNAFVGLVDDIRAHLDPSEWEQFVVRAQKNAVEDGGKPLSAAGLRSEMVANLLSDYAYRAHTDVAGAEFAGRGGDFTGYGGYLREGAQESVDAALDKFLAAHGQSSGSFRNAQEQNNPSGVSTQAERDEAVAYVTKVLGPRIKVEFKNLTGYSGEFIDAKNVIEISTTAAAGTMGTAWHEAMHVFFRDFVKSNPGMVRTFESLVNDPKHLAKIHALLNGYPAAQAQLSSGEERLAYTYQFWKAGLMQVDAEAKTWLQKLGKFFRRVAGMVRDSERALELFTAFDKGAMQDPSAAALVIEKALGKGQWTLKQRQKLDALVQGVAAMTMPSGEILESSVSEKARKLSRMLFTNPGDQKAGSDEEGYLNARRRMAAKYNNMFAQAISDLNEGDQNAVQKFLQQETELADIAYEPHRAAVKSIRALLQRFHQYMTESGLEIGHAGEKYYPTVWSLDTLLNNKAEFIEMLVTKYASNLNPDNGNVQKAAERVYASLISKDGVDAHMPASRDDGVLAPFFASQNNRTLPWLAAADKEKYMQKNMVGTLSRYFHQGARSTEYFRRFGKDGVKLDETLYGTKVWNTATKSYDRLSDGITHELQKAAKDMPGMSKEQQRAWATRQMRDVTRSVSAMEGTLGKDVSPTMRKFSSWMNVYQNIRLLPLSLFSSFVDPLGLLARGGTFQESYDAFLSGMREVFAGWRDAFRDMPAERQKNEWEKLAEFVGTVDAAMFSHHVADEYSSVYMSPAAKKINDKMFVLNGMEAWNRGMRVAATKSAVKFIERHAKNVDPAHSKRWLQELGLTAAQVYTDPDGGLITDRHVLAQAHGMVTCSP